MKRERERVTTPRTGSQRLCSPAPPLAGIVPDGMIPPRTPLALSMLLLVGCGTPVNSGLGGGPLPLGDAGNTRSGANPCETICTAQARAGCTNFSMGTCVSSCARDLARVPGCVAAFEAAVACIRGATFTCDRDGDPTLMTCVAESAPFLACLRAQRDAGTPRPDVPM